MRGQLANRFCVKQQEEMRGLEKRYYKVVSGLAVPSSEGRQGVNFQGRRCLSKRRDWN